MCVSANVRLSFRNNPHDIDAPQVQRNVSPTSSTWSNGTLGLCELHEVDISLLFASRHGKTAAMWRCLGEAALGLGSSFLSKYVTKDRAQHEDGETTIITDVHKK